MNPHKPEYVESSPGVLTYSPKYEEWHQGERKKHHEFNRRSVRQWEEFEKLLDKGGWAEYSRHVSPEGARNRMFKLRKKSRWPQGQVEFAYEIRRTPTNTAMGVVLVRWAPGTARGEAAERARQSTQAVHEEWAQNNGVKLPGGPDEIPVEQQYWLDVPAMVADERFTTLVDALFDCEGSGDLLQLDKKYVRTSQSYVKGQS